MSLTAGLKHSRTRNPEKLAIVFGEQSWTYAEFDELTNNVANNLLAAGLERGDRVAFHLLNGPELALGYWGCLKAGGITVPINTRLKGPEIDYILRHSGSACYIGQPDLYTEAVSSCPAITALELRYLTGGQRGSRTSLFDNLLRSADCSVPVPEIAPNQVATILYTSGTTARPKGVMHSHASLIQTAHTMYHMQLDRDQVAVVMSSMTHLVGFGMVFLSGLLNGATIVITRPFDFKNVLRSYGRWGCTYTVGLPVMFHGLLQTQSEMPQDVALYQHPAVSEVGVVGRPDPVWGEVLVAFVVLRSGQAVTGAELISFAREGLADYKTPECVIFRDELPKGPTGKIQRRALAPLV
jgi:acyl-CoA synthetase (AMP-forming)/AMP-acid ligase II